MTARNMKTQEEQIAFSDKLSQLTEQSGDIDKQLTQLTDGQYDNDSLATLLQAKQQKLKEISDHVAKYMDISVEE
jgi:hypothetical protein